MTDVIQQLQDAADKATQASAQAKTWANGGVGVTVPTDSGPVPTIAEFTRVNQVRADNAINALGWVLAGDFTAGCTVTDRNQYVLVVGGAGYRWDGVIPPGGKVVAPGSSPTPIATGAWVLVGVENSQPFTISVGTTGNFSNINDALIAAYKMRPVYNDGNSRCVITLLSGFVMNEQVILKGGEDFSWLEINAQDEITRIEHSAITQYLSELDDSRPAFGARDNSKLPVIGCKFAYDNNTTSWDGVSVLFGSKASFKPNSGILRCRRGIQALYQSTAYCYMSGLPIGGAGSGAGSVIGVQFPFARLRALHVAFNSSVGLARSNFTFCGGDAAAYIIWDSNADLYQSQLNDSVGTAIYCRDGSNCSARETNVARSNRGYHALHNSRINARSKESIESSTWTGDGAKDCTDYGAIASYCSQIDATELDVSGCGNIGVHASGGSSVCFNNGLATGCGTHGVYASTSSTIDANGVNASNAGVSGFIASNASTINADTSLSDGCQKGYNASESSTIQARNSSADACSQHGFYALRSSRINCRGSGIIGGVIGVYAEENSHINAQSVSITGVITTYGHQVTRGSQINANGATGTLSTSANVVTASGIIFQ